MLFLHFNLFLFSDALVLCYSSKWLCDDLYSAHKMMPFFYQQLLHRQISVLLLFSFALFIEYLEDHHIEMGGQSLLLSQCNMTGVTHTDSA